MVRPETLKLDHVYSLQGGAYLVGPKQVRKTIELASRARCRELEQARRDHRRLDKQISELDEPRRLGSPSAHAEVKSLKREKLRLKDHIGELERRQSDSRATAAVTQLGAGGFGKVWLATCMSTNREVAIKVRLGGDVQRIVPVQAQENACEGRSICPSRRSCYRGAMDPITSWWISRHAHASHAGHLDG